MNIINVGYDSTNYYAIEFKGGKAVEHLDKRNNRSTLTYVAGDRLLVTLEGRNTTVDLLKQAAGSMNLK